MNMKLSDLVQNLKQELRAASEAGKNDPMFTVSRATIKTRVQVVDKTNTSGSIEIFIAKAGVGGESTDVTEHEVTIELTGPDLPVLG